MSRIGKKPIPLPSGVKFDVAGSTVVVQGPKGKVTTHLPPGVKLQTADGHINVTRESEDRAAVHYPGELYAGRDGVGDCVQHGGV